MEKDDLFVLHDMVSQVADSSDTFRLFFNFFSAGRSWSFPLWKKAVLVLLKDALYQAVLKKCTYSWKYENERS